MANTYIPIATVTVGSGGAANIEFTSIPQTYTDLLVKASLRDNRTDSPVTDTVITFNSSGSGYSIRMLYGDASFSTPGSATTSGAVYIAGQYQNTNQTTSNTFSNTEIYIPNYTSSNNKSISVDAVTETNGTPIYASIVAGLWANSSVISSIKLAPMYGTLAYVQHSSATLYGIKNS
jgi:hypothetical protein